MGTTICGMNADRVAIACSNRQGAGQVGQKGLVIINLQCTPYDDQCSLRIWGVLDRVMALLATELDVTVPNKKCKSRGEEWVHAHPRCLYNTPTRSSKDPL